MGIWVGELDGGVGGPVPSVLSKGHRSFVFVGHRDDAEPVEVQLGLASDEFVEIKSGLEPGASVLLAVALPRLPAVTTSIILLVQPVLAVGFAMLLLSESPSPMQLLRVALVIGGVPLGSLGRSRLTIRDAAPCPPRAAVP